MFLNNDYYKYCKIYIIYILLLYVQIKTVFFVKYNVIYFENVVSFSLICVPQTYFLFPHMLCG